MAEPTALRQWRTAVEHFAAECDGEVDSATSLLANPNLKPHARRWLETHAEANRLLAGQLRALHPPKETP